MKNPIKKRLQTETFKRLAETFVGKKNFNWWALFYASMIFIVTGWLPDGIAELLRKEWVGGGYKTIVSLAILLFIGFRLKEALKYKSKIEVRSEHPDCVKALAIFLSKLSMKKEIQDKELAEIKQALDSNSFKVDLMINKTWEMPMLAIKYHLPELKYLYTLTSSGQDGSSQLMSTFKQVVNYLYPSVEVIELTPGGIHFEEIKIVFEAIERFYSEVKEKGISEKDIIVDITAGQKTNSIAASIATLAMGRQFQYISTINKEVLSYDVGYFEEG